MKRFSKLQRTLIVINICVCLLACMMLALRQRTISNYGYSIWTYLKYGLIDKPFTSLGDAVEDFSNLWHAYEDNVYLNEQLANQRSYQTLYAQQVSRTQELEGLLQMQNALPETPLVNAEVISRSGQSWNQTCTISAGANSGIEENMLVISSQGAVGFISKVQDDTSIVSLLSAGNYSNDITIMITKDDGTADYGVLRGYDAENNLYEAVLFDDDTVVYPGQKISTAGLGQNYPSGVLVGTVTSTAVGDDALISTVYIEPVSDLDSFTYVAVAGAGVIQP
jgi:rod shape-determining protein MreC